MVFCIHFDVVLIYLSLDFFVENTLVLILLLFLAHSEWKLFYGREPILRKAGRRIITKHFFFCCHAEHTGKQQPQYLGHILYEKVER
jgi:hypothetical protein